METQVLALLSWRALVGFRRKSPYGHCYRYSRRGPLACIGTANLAVRVGDRTLVDGYGAACLSQIAGFHAAMAIIAQSQRDHLFECNQP